jgi:hypothetical protein
MCCISPPHLMCIVSPGAGRASIQRCGWILTNQRRRVPFPSCRSGGAGPACNAERVRRCTARWGACRGSTPEEAARWWDGNVEEIGHKWTMETRARMLALFLYAGAVFEGASEHILDVPVGYGPIAQNLQYTGVLQFTFLAHMAHAS